MNRDEIPAANAVQGVRWQIGPIPGPALGELLVTQVGLAAACTVDVATFLAMPVAHVDT